MKTVIEYNSDLIHIDTESVLPPMDKIVAGDAAQSLRYKRTLIHLWCLLNYPDATTREGAEAMAVCVKVDDVIDPVQTDSLHEKLLADLPQIEGMHGMEWLKLRQTMQNNSRPKPESIALETELNLI